MKKRKKGKKIQSRRLNSEDTKEDLVEKSGFKKLPSETQQG